MPARSARRRPFFRISSCVADDYTVSHRAAADPAAAPVGSKLPARQKVKYRSTHSRFVIAIGLDRERGHAVNHTIRTLVI
jgi:hypothetical protein